MADDLQDNIVEALRSQEWGVAEALSRQRLQQDRLWAQGWLFLAESLERQEEVDSAWACYDRTWILDPRATWASVVTARLKPNGVQWDKLPEWLSSLLAVPTVHIVGAMIARDEERTILETVTHLQEAVDEVVVVDTGSTDRTAQIAEEAGARVVHYEWSDDFAAARNAAAPYLDGDWVLWVDADEVLDPEDVHVPRTVAGLYQESPTPALIRIVQVNRIGDRVDPNYDTTRFYPLNRGFEWRGRIHEQVVHAADVAPKIVRPVVRVRLNHDGYEPSIMQQKGKLARNIALLRKALQEDPRNVGVMGFLGRDLYVDGQLDAAIAVLIQAEKLGLVTPSYGRMPEVRHVLTEAYMRQQKWDEAEAVVNRLTHDTPEFPGGWYLAGQIHLARAQSQLNAAANSFTKAQETHKTYRGSVSYHADIPGFLSVVGLADVSRFQTRWDQAWTLFEQALAVYPDHAGIRHQLDHMREQSQKIVARVDTGQNETPLTEPEGGHHGDSVHTESQ